MNKKVDLASFDNTWYNTGASLPKRIAWYFFNMIFFNSYLFPFNSFKRKLLRLFGCKVGKKLVIKPKVNIKYPWKLKIGNNVWIGENVWIDNLDYIEIGDNVCISQGALLICGNHNYKKTSFDLMVGKIIVEDGVWIGARSTVTPNVRLRTHTVIAVGSVVSSDTEEYSIYRGNPAVKIKDRIID